jgi:hypothetical protein
MESFFLSNIEVGSHFYIKYATVEIFNENIVKINDLMKSYNYTNKGLIPKKYISQDYLFTYNNS